MTINSVYLKTKKTFSFFFKVILYFMLILLVLLTFFRVTSLTNEDKTAEDIAPKEGIYVQTLNDKIYIQTLGDASAPKVLLIHGTAAWSGLWRETSVFLANNGYQVYAIDLAPFGFSSRPSVVSYSRENQSKRILGLLKSLGLEKTIIVGHSFGAGATVEAVMRQENMFSGMVLIDGALNLSAQDKNTELPLLLKNGFIREVIVSATVTNPLLTEFLLKSLLYKTDINLDKYVNILQKPMKIQGSTKAVSDWLPSLLLDDSSALSSDRNRYSDIKIPVKLIWGAKDTVTPLSQAKDLQVFMPEASLSILDEVGHIPQIENPSMFQKRLLESLNEISQI